VCVKESGCLFGLPLFPSCAPLFSLGGAAGAVVAAPALRLSFGSARVWVGGSRVLVGAFALSLFFWGCSVVSSSSVSLVLGSHSAGFAAGLRLLSRVAVGGSLSLDFCSYGTGSAYVSFVPVPAVAPVWAAVASLAFRPETDGVGDLEFVAGWSVGLSNHRAAALDALLEAVGA